MPIRFGKRYLGGTVQSADPAPRRSFAEPAPLSHKNRQPEDLEIATETRERLKLPPAHDTTEWNALNNSLLKKLALSLPDSVFQSESASQIAGKISSIVYTSLKDKFGGHEEPIKHEVKTKRKPNKRLAELRKEKKELKKARQLLHRNGQKNTAADKANSKRWFQVMHEHARLRRALELRYQARVRTKQHRRVQSDPMKFGKTLFEKKTSGEPTFSADQGYNYFSKLYKDDAREAPVFAMPEMKRPDMPSHLLEEAAPTRKEIAEAIRKKSNGAAPGLDGISYVPYKRCEAIIWSSKEIPSDWAAASIILLAKSTKTADPAEFRPIALTNTIGKIFFAVIAKRLEMFMVSNNFISNVQKGFKAETPGCLEHSFAMFEALLDAKFNQRQIVVSWLDLKNAYGSVRHNLIQFALSWFHVPKLICELIFDYYEKIRAQIRSKDWQTDFFKFDIGLFQGCVLSCILFNCVFQMLLNLTSQMTERNGYHLKDSTTVLHDQAFADDISITTSTPELNQKTINVAVKFLNWFMLQANPKKCISMAMKKFDPRYMPKIDYERYGATAYCPFDPNLKIGEEKLKFIVDVAANPETLQRDHFKELGRFISVDLKEEKVKKEIRRRLLNDMDTVDASGVNGLDKLFIYEHFVVRRLSWVFLVHDLSLSFARELNKRVIPRLKSWAGLYRSSDIGTLFRLRDHLGLQLTSIEHHYEHLQLVKCCLLENSKDENIRSLYKMRAERVISQSNRWSAPKELAF